MFHNLVYRGLMVFVIIAIGFCLVTTTGHAKNALAQPPKEVNIGWINNSVIEEPWNTAWFQAMERVKKEKPHGLDIKWDALEDIPLPDAARVLNEMAKTGKYDIMWPHNGFADVVEPLALKYPEILWVITGSGNRGLGGNVYWVDSIVHEPAYLMGLLAGMMTKSGVIGTVASYAVPTEDAAINAYVEGARSVDPGIKHRITYIENWFDPPKAKESTYAQIAAGADIICAVTFGPFEACQEKGVPAFGFFVDQNSLAPETVVTSALSFWDPSIKYIIDQWWAYKTQGTPYNGPLDRVYFLMKDGGSDIAPYHSLDSWIPPQVKTAIQKKKKEIMEGVFTVPINMEKVTSSK